MATNIKIVPSNSILRTTDRIPYIEFINNAGNTPIDIKVLSGATITFSSSTQADILSIQPKNNIVSIGNNLNVKNYFSVGGIQVIDGTLNWIGPQSGLIGPQGSQGAQGSSGGTANPIPPAITIATNTSNYFAYGNFGTWFYSTYNLNGTGNIIYTSTTINSWRRTQTDGVFDGPMNRCSISGNCPDNIYYGFNACLTVGATKTYYIGIGADNDYSLRIDGVKIIDTLGGPYDDKSDAFAWWHVYPLTIGAGSHTIELLGLNKEDVEGFGCEIYDNTLAQLLAATSVSDLNIIYSSSAQTVANVVVDPATNTYLSSGFTCPNGWIYSTCSGLCINYSGTTGPQGFSGNTGPTGVQGAQGFIGFTGNTGNSGAQGATGAQGNSGAQGATGIQGAQGAQGAQGPKGFTGFTGPTGAQGAQGAQGARGPTGPTGAQGAQGFQGFRGFPGFTGPSGTPSAIQGAQGATGAQGAQGATGAQGAQGAVTGAQGAQGPVGFRGPQGPIGVSGTAGPQGPQGVQGSQGFSGFTGAPGNSGPAKVSGAQGAQGFQGATGAQGSPGASSPSDRRLKDNIINIKDVLEKTKKLRGVEFIWDIEALKIKNLTNPSFRNKVYFETGSIGFIAQEVEEIIPEIVWTDKYGYKTLQYNLMVTLAIGSIQEQQKIIDSIYNRINILKKVISG